MSGKILGNLPVSVVICTLNEAENIEGVVQACRTNYPQEIIVVDGGSQDGTQELALSLGVRVIECGSAGLASQTWLGVQSASCPFVALIHADDRPSTGFLETLLRELDQYGLDAIDGVTHPAEVSTYWQRGWANAIMTLRTEVQETIMVGRPALYRRDCLIQVGLDPEFKYATEDTDLSRCLQVHGKKQGHGTGISFRIHEKGFRQSVGKWVSYGRGYAQFASKYPDRWLPVFFHAFLGVGIVRYMRKLPGSLTLLPFYLLYGFFCGLGFGLGYLRLNRYREVG